MSIHITAFLKSKPGNADKVLPLVTTLVEGSLKEEACLQYELYRDVDNENLFFLHETWRDAAGIDLHMKQPHFQVLSKIAEYLDEPIAVYKTTRLI